MIIKVFGRRKEKARDGREEEARAADPGGPSATVHPLPVRQPEPTPAPAPETTREEAQAAILAQISGLRGRMNPDVVRQLDEIRDRNAAAEETRIDPDHTKQVVRLFLQDRQDGGRFKARLAEALKNGLSDKTRLH